MSLSVDGLRQVLLSGVAEIKFTRRHPVSGRPSTRRMLASLNSSILDSDLGRKIFNFTPPSYPAAYDAASRGLVVAYDIFMQDWRAIPAPNTTVIQILPSDPPELFWEYFTNVLAKMSSGQKAAFIDK